MKIGQTVAMAVLAIGGSVLAWYHVASQVYYPTLQLRAPEGFTYSVVQDPTGERQACGAANDRFLEPVRAQCKDCKVLYARCLRHLDESERVLVSQNAALGYVVLSPGMHMAISGPKARLRAVCDRIADDMVSRGYSSAACIYPRGPQAPAGQ
ncbi:MAG TPA: hypothetical protein VNE59_04160 [Burkholderiales bacterium]|nr:hypothetical protein [Burkholderiales bacterium]